MIKNIRVGIEQLRLANRDEDDTHREIDLRSSENMNLSGIDLTRGMVFLGCDDIGWFLAHAVGEWSPSIEVKGDSAFADAAAIFKKAASDYLNESALATNRMIEAERKANDLTSARRPEEA